MENIINIYDDDQSELILDESSFNPTVTYNFHNLGEAPVTPGNPDGNWSIDNTNQQKYQNSSFLELHIFDENDNFILSLNSGKPLLQLPSSGKYYFDDFHFHNGEYMVGKKHTQFPHEKLNLVRDTQITPYSYDEITPGSETTAQKYVIKISEVFQILKNTEGFNLQKDTKFKFKYAVLGDLFLQASAKYFMSMDGGQMDQEQGSTT